MNQNVWIFVPGNTRDMTVCEDFKILCVKVIVIFCIIFTTGINSQTTDPSNPEKGATTQAQTTNDAEKNSSSGTIIKCQNGTFIEQVPTDTDGISEPICTTCPLGFYCYNGDKLQCPPGHYCPPGQTQPLVCNSGSYCPPGRLYPVSCRAGFFNPNNGSTNQSSCLACPPGHFCFTRGLSRPSGECLEGYYCKGGSKTATPIDDVVGGKCPPGHKCPTGSSMPVPCPLGTYNDVEAQGICFCCPENLTCLVGAILPKECITNQEIEDIRYVNITACDFLDGNQPTEEFCNGEANVPQICPRGHLCAKEYNMTCPSGYFCPNGTTVYICPAGFYCPEGQQKPTPCNIGTFNPQVGNRSQDACIKCSNGVFCSSKALTVPTGPCKAGFYCTQGSATPTPVNGVTGNICPAGSFCVEGTSFPTPCPNNTYNPSRGKTNKTDCLPCPGEFTCSQVGLALPIECDLEESDIKMDCSELGGDYCQFDQDCLNNGSCMIYNGTDKGSCHCVLPYEGSFCEIDTTLLFILDNTTFSATTVERGPVTLQFEIGTSFTGDENIEFKWYRNGLVVRNSSRIEITQVQRKDYYPIYKSTLNVKSSRRNDAGIWNVSATIKSLSVTKNMSVSVDVIPLPSVIVDPMVTSGLVGDDVTLTCTVQSHPNLTIRVDWMKDGKRLETRKKGYSTRRNVLSLRNIQKSEQGRYTCRVSYRSANVTGTIVKSAALHVYTAEPKRCKPTTDHHGIEWKQGIAGINYTQPCSVKHVGNAYKLCKEDGKWDRTNAIDCVDESINNAETMMDEILTDNISEPDYVKNVVDSQLHVMRNWSAQNTGTSGDVKKTVGILDMVLEATKKADVTVPEKDFLGIVNNVLDKRQTDNWRDINEQTKTGSAKILSTVSEFGIRISKSLNIDEDRTYSEDNYMITVARKNKQTPIIFPKSTETDKSSFKLPVQSSFDSPEIVYTATLFKTMADFLPGRNDLTGNITPGDEYNINSDVLSMTLKDKPEGFGLEPGIAINFHHSVDVDHQGNNISCMFWNFTIGAWSSSGCNTTKIDNHRTRCECDHLTNFAVLMRPYGKEEDDSVLSLISLVGCSISIILSTLTFAIYIFLWRYVKNDQNTVLVHLCLSISLSYLLFLVGIDKTDNKILCTVIAVFLQYLFLVVFFLMLAMGIYYFIQITIVYYSFSTANDIRARMNITRLLPIAWGIPVLITGITIGATYSREYNPDYICWLSVESGALYGFVGPVLLIICINVIIICSLFRVMCATQLLAQSNTKKKAATGLRSLCTLLPVLGITWVFGILSINDDLQVFQYLFAISNSLQGFFIFIPSCIFNKKVREGLLQRMRLYTSQQENSKIQNSKAYSKEPPNSNIKTKSKTLRKTVPPVLLLKYTKKLDYIDGGYDNVCYESSLPLDTVQLKHNRSLSQDTIKTSETSMNDSRTEENAAG